MVMLVGVRGGTQTEPSGHIVFPLALIAWREKRLQLAGVGGPAKCVEPIHVGINAIKFVQNLCEYFGKWDFLIDLFDFRIKIDVITVTVYMHI